MIGRGGHKKTKPSQACLPKQYPQILSYFDYDKTVIERPWENFSATCNHCNKNVRGSIKVTTNFTNHIKDKCAVKNKSSDLVKQQTLNGFLDVEPQKWNKNSKTQKEIQDLFVSTLNIKIWRFEVRTQFMDINTSIQRVPIISEP
ncbi:unnamed protein product [Brachionus calyciflorus]|uniref:BED-type domain-containing protein n=1 Tax=Brachionus calyciflorus TaxID=104777 RepID=A0A814E352_9BILA|nr:unnamed protein product [Brachionus calyciflorus]